MMTRAKGRPPRPKARALTSRPMLTKNIGTSQENARLCMPPSSCCRSDVRAKSNPARNAPVMAAIPPMASDAQAYNRVTTMARDSAPSLIGSRSTQDPNRGISRAPSQAAKPKKPTIFTVTHNRAETPPPPPPIMAMKSERNRITSTSSPTAAPSKATPTRVRNTPNSIMV